MQRRDVADPLTPVLPDGPREESLQFVSELKVGEQQGAATQAAAALQTQCNRSAAGSVPVRDKAAVFVWAGPVVLGGRERRVVGSSWRQGAAGGHCLRERRVPLGATGTLLLGKGAHLAPARGRHTLLVSRAISCPVLVPKIQGAWSLYGCVLSAGIYYLMQNGGCTSLVLFPLRIPGDTFCLLHQRGLFN